MTPLIRRALAMAGAVALVCAAAATGSAAGTGPRHVVFSIGPAEVTESSSLVLSTTHPHLVYTANDSGDAGNVYVLDDRTGRLVGTTHLAGIDPVDDEAMAGGTDGNLVVADIGDNQADHPSVHLYLVPQPGRGDVEVTPKVVTLTYPKGPRDAEGALYDASTGRVFVVSKVYAGARVYRTPPHVFSRSTAVLHAVAPAPSIATDATFLPGQHVVAIRTYLDVTYYRFPSWLPITTQQLPLEAQGESVTVAPDGHHLWIGSEGVHSKVLSVAIPDVRRVRPPPAQHVTTPGPVDAHRQDLVDRARLVEIAAFALLVIVLAVVVVRFIRHPRT